MPSLSATTVGPSPAAPTIPLRTRSAPELGDQLANALLAGEDLPVPGSERARSAASAVAEGDGGDAVPPRLLER